MAYEARITGAAKAFHEKMFPGYVSDFLRTDPEFIERFDTFAFDEVVAARRRKCTPPPTSRRATPKSC